MPSSSAQDALGSAQDIPRMCNRAGAILRPAQRQGKESTVEAVRTIMTLMW